MEESELPFISDGTENRADSHVVMEPEDMKTSQVSSLCEEPMTPIDELEKSQD